MLTPLDQVLDRVDSRLLSPAADVRLWPTGFHLLDSALGGGLRAGSLNLLAGSQGEGKTTFALQIARETARARRPVLFFSYELEAEALVQKLIASEAADRTENPISVYQVRAAFEGNDDAHGGLLERLSRHPGGMDALSAVSDYSTSMMIHRSTTSATKLEVISDIIQKVIDSHGEPPLVVVDYLQKVRPVDPPESEEQAVSQVAERLKDIAIDFGCPVLAISASDRAGLEPGQRMRARNMKGSTALAYEADLVLILSNKADIVARHHLMYSANNGEHFRSFSVLTIDKNRSGRTGAELEFKKEFASGRFLPEPNVVHEHLVDERVFTQ